MSLMLPGDLCGLTHGAAPLDPSGFATVTPCELISIPSAEAFEAFEAQPRLAEQAWRAASVLDRIREERLLSLGRRAALERMAHLLCELAVRQGREGQAAPLPVSQADLADILGMSTVHVNRVLQALRARRLVEVRRGRFTLFDFDSLAKLAGFDPAYLGGDPSDS